MAITIQYTDEFRARVMELAPGPLNAGLREACAAALERGEHEMVGQYLREVANLRPTRLLELLDAKDYDALEECLVSARDAETLLSELGREAGRIEHEQRFPPDPPPATPP